MRLADAMVARLSSPQGNRRAVSTRRTHFSNTARLILGLLFSAIALLGQNGAPAAISDLPLNERRHLPIDLVEIRPTPVGLSDGFRETSPNYHPKNRHNKDKYDVYRIGSRRIGDGINLYSVDRELQLGRELAAETDAEVRKFRDPIVIDYINRIAQDLARHSDAKVPLTVKVVDSDEVNAFSLPGGYLYINTGLLLASESEAELAGVMAHEIAHVAARHATKTVTRKQLFNLASVPLSLVGGGAASVITQAMGVAGPISFLKFSRNAEREADLLGLEYAYSSGYDPAEFVRFMERARKASREKKTSFLVRLVSTHPMTDDRIRRAQDEIATMLPPKQEYVVTTSEFEDVRMRLVQLRASQPPAAENPTLRRRTRDDTHPETPEGPGP